MTRTFVQGNDRIDRMLSNPAMAEKVAEIQSRAEDEDRTYAMSLAMVREAGKLTQVELADRLHVTQGAVSRLESRGDALLSTLHKYLEAAGAVHTRLIVTVNGQDVELDLSALTKA
ncbi:helix-turn-helix domain-containing protein [Lacisediminihabitans sp. H27-G8]|uniref:helix-turn-helix domain-containing protein n=1 Tax=Lacisediminihabitans sp. H27-G8 TaxID=3111909 RepID=UPI0038FBED02